MFDKKEWQRQWIKDNPEKVKADNDKRKDYRRQRYLENRQARIAYSKQWAKDHPEKIKGKWRKQKEKDPEAWREYQRNWIKNSRRTKLGLTAERYLEMLEECKGKCPICGRGFSFEPTLHDHRAKPCVDHSKKTGKIRGVICWKCNISIGFLNEDIVTVERLLEYLKKNE